MFTRLPLAVDLCHVLGASIEDHEGVVVGVQDLFVVGIEVFLELLLPIGKLFHLILVLSFLLVGQKIDLFLRHVFDLLFE